MPREPRWNAVIDSAARLFARNGFAATSVREIAEGARLTKAGLYYHIRGKEDLLYRICEHSIAAVLAFAHAGPAAESEPRARLAALMRHHVDFFVAHPDNLKVLTREMGALSPGPRAKIADLEREYLDLIRGIIRRGRATGTFRDIDPTVAAFTVLSVINNLFDWYDPKGPMGPEALVGHLEAMLLGGLCAQTPENTK